jgi:hypothetical protein
MALVWYQYDGSKDCSTIFKYSYDSSCSVCSVASVYRLSYVVWSICDQQFRIICDWFVVAGY